MSRWHSDDSSLGLSCGPGAGAGYTAPWKIHGVPVTKEHIQGLSSLAVMMLGCAVSEFGECWVTPESFAVGYAKKRPAIHHQQDYKRLVQRRLAALHKRGLLDKAPVPWDKRRKAYRLTPEGRAIGALCVPVWRAA